MKQYISIPIFILSLMTGFLLCCWYGLSCSRLPLLSDFRRFHLFIGPATGFAITSGEMLSILPKDSEKITVVVGGNSVFNCIALPVEKLWTDSLQKRLGDKFAVVNFSLDGALPFEVGYLAAESLFKQGRKVIYLTDSVPGECGASFGYVYSSLFFDFKARGLLMEDEERSSWLQSNMREEARFFNPAMAEQELLAQLDSRVNAVDLWQNIGYNHFFTIWSQYTNPDFWRPRRGYKDHALSRPWPSDDLLKSELAAVRERCDYLMQRDCMTYVPVDSNWHLFDMQASRVVPRSMRDNVILSLVRYNPQLLDVLSADERECDRLMYEEGARRWRRFGFDTVVIGGNYQSGDYIDANHFSLSGTDRLVNEMVDLVRARAKKLGYLP